MAVFFVIPLKPISMHINIPRLSVCFLALASLMTARAEHLVLLTTNDTHSQLLPDADNLGGAARRKAIVDSVRTVRDNAMLIDAGDVVQGTLFFNIGGGKAEEEIMNALGYDIRILGNHEFDNGADSLASVLSAAKAELLATNYDFTGSPLKPLFKKYTLRDVGGKRIGFIGINLQPKGMIAEGNYDGVRYLDAINTANSAARYLKDVEGADMVVAITHVGYNPSMPPGDLDIAANASDIDLIIGGHSHTTIDPKAGNIEWLVADRNGRRIPVTQTGKRGHYVGEIDIDLDDMTTQYRLIPVDSRLDKYPSPAIDSILRPYSMGIDSLMNYKIGETAMAFDKDKDPLLNLVADYMLTRGNELAGNVDLGIINKGGLRTSLPKGDISEGMVIMMMPFNNYATVLDIKGSDLLATFDVMARTAGNGVSKNVSVVFDPATKKCVSAKINGKPVDPDKTYRLSTIDYLANGGDYMEPLRNGKVVARSPRVLYQDIIGWIQNSMKGKKIKASGEKRVRPL